MRLSSLSLAALLLSSSIVFAQHHESGSAPSAAPSPASSPAPSPSPAPSTSTSSASSISHSNVSSSPAPASTPVSHSPTSVNSTPNQGSAPRSTESNSTRIMPGSHEAENNSHRVIPDQKISGSEKIISAPRIGETPLEKAHESKAGETDLRRRICENGSCKEPSPARKPVESDLRRRICIEEPCQCPAGQMASKGGCVANTSRNSEPVVDNSLASMCAADEFWDGASCISRRQCQPGEFWNGANCMPSSSQCAGIEARAATLANELRGTKAQIQQACSQNPPAPDCESLKLSQQVALQRYQMLLTEAGPNCQTGLLDPLALQ